MYVEFTPPIFIQARKIKFFGCFVVVKMVSGKCQKNLRSGRKWTGQFETGHVRTIYVR